MSELVFPPPDAGRQPRWASVVYLTVVAALAVVLYLWEGWSGVGRVLILTCISLGMSRWLGRSRTVVTPGEVRIRGLLRSRAFPAAEIADVGRATQWSPVQVRLRTGETLALPHVPAEQVHAVRETLFG